MVPWKRYGFGFLQRDRRRGRQSSRDAETRSDGKNGRKRLHGGGWMYNPGGRKSKMEILVEKKTLFAHVRRICQEIYRSAALSPADVHA
jgi:hypothetical protein